MKCLWRRKHQQNFNADDIFKLIFLYEICCIMNQISLRYILKRLTDNKSGLVKIMAWCWTGDKTNKSSSLSPLLPNHLSQWWQSYWCIHICITQQWLFLTALTHFCIYIAIYIYWWQWSLIIHDDSYIHEMVNIADTSYLFNHWYSLKGIMQSSLYRIYNLSCMYRHVLLWCQFHMVF